MINNRMAKKKYEIRHGIEELNDKWCCFFWDLLNNRNFLILGQMARVAIGKNTKNYYFARKISFQNLFLICG